MIQTRRFFHNGDMRLQWFIISLVSVTLLSSSALAQQKLYRLDPRGRSLEITVPPNTKTKSLTAYVVAKGNETQYVNFSATGPSGVQISARSQVLSGKNIARFVRSNKRWNAVTFKTNSSNLKSLRISGSSTSSFTPFALSSGQCQGFTFEQLDEIIRTLSSMGVNYTRQELCRIYEEYGITGVPGGGSSSGGNGGGDGNSFNSPSNLATGLALVRKDTCATKKTTNYIVRFDISLARVSAADKANGFKVTLTAAPLVHRGSKAATVKPTSDGKFAPRALFLLNTTGGFGYGSEQMNVVRWSNRKPRVSNVRIEDYVPYRGLYLARAVAESHVRGGGRATVELLGNSSAYSVCFRMVKARQRVNGYTN